MHIKVFTAFSGYDSQCLALDLLHETHPDFSYNLVGWSEIDKYAIKAHNVLFPDAADLNFGDISKINWNIVPDFDLFTYSFPCTDISNAGEQRGLERGSGTRSSLLWECERAIETKRPKFLLMENVKALTSKKFAPYLHEWQKLLESYGYVNHTAVLNATDYNVPQNRERCFMFSTLNTPSLHQFRWPVKRELQYKLADVLDDEVDEHYYLKSETVAKYLEKTRLNQEQGKGFGFFPETPTERSAGHSVAEAGGGIASHTL